jgi:hypothetical protein
MSKPVVAPHLHNWVRFSVLCKWIWASIEAGRR